MSLALHIVAPSGRTLSVSLDDGTVDVGRTSANDVRLPYPMVSGRHFRLVNGEVGWTIEDLGSKNGTKLDGRRISAFSPELLHDGAEIRLGELSISVGFEHSTTADSFTLTESGIVLRKLIADRDDLSSQALMISADEQVVLPDSADDVRPTDDAFRIDRRGAGFWLTPLSDLTIAGEPVPAAGIGLTDGIEVVGAKTWRFNDPVESHVDELDDDHDKAPGEFDATGLMMLGCGTSTIAAALLLTLLFLL